MQDVWQANPFMYFTAVQVVLPKHVCARIALCAAEPVGRHAQNQQPSAYRTYEGLCNHQAGGRKRERATVLAPGMVSSGVCYLRLLTASRYPSYHVSELHEQACPLLMYRATVGGCH